MKIKEKTMNSKMMWKAYFKNGVCNTCVVEGKDEDEAKIAALAEYRRNTALMDDWTIDMVVNKVVPIV